MNAICKTLRRDRAICCCPPVDGAGDYRKRFALHNYDGILQCSDSGNGNAHGVVRVQRKRVFGNNACACQQYRTVGKFLRTEKIFCKLTEPALNLIDRNLTIEYASAAAPNLEMNRPLPRS